MKPISDLIVQYLDELESLKFSPETLRKTRLELNRFNHFLNKTVGVQTTDSLCGDHLKKWQKHLSTYHTSKGYPLKALSINVYVAKVRGFLKYLAKEGYIHKRLRQSISYVKVPKHLPTSILTHSQAKTVLEKASADSQISFRNRTMLELLYSTGIRVSELLGLNMNDIDLKNRTAHVMGKGGKERVVPVGKTALGYLETYVTAIRPFLLKKPHQALFLSKNGRRLDYSSFRRMVKSTAGGLDISVDVTAHTFRRSCTTELIRGGANVYHVKQLLGHESLETLSPYTRLDITDLKKTHSKCHPRELENDS